MLKENQFVLTTWNPSTQKYYQSKGYTYTHRGEEFSVRIEDLLQGSHARVTVVCDFCGEEYTKIYKDYFAQHKNGDCCVKCEGKKSLLATELKHGKGFRGEKLKELVKEKYGVSNIAKVPEIMDKIKETNTQKYGVENALLLSSSKELAKLNGWNEKARVKRENTNLEKYGSKYGLSSVDVRKKIFASYYTNSTQKTSTQQTKLYELLKEIYNNCELNYPCGNCSLDCFVEVNGVKIDVEYDGMFWHKGKEVRDRKRDEFIKSQGYKILRVKGSHNIPQKEEVVSSINFLVTTTHSFTQIFTT